MKKKINSYKFIFAFIAVFTFVGGVCAYKSTTTETLSNTVSENKTTRNTAAVEAELTSSFDTYITDIQNVKNINGGNLADGGIRCKTIIKRKNWIGFWSEKKSEYIGVYKNSADISTGWGLGEPGYTRVEWEDWTGNTSFKATFAV